MEIPVVKDISTRYSSREKDYLKENPDIDFIFNYIMESPDVAGKPVTIHLKPEHLTLFIIELLVETVDYIESDLYEFRKVSTDAKFFNPQGNDSGESDGSIIPLDDKITIASYIAGDLMLFLDESGRKDLQSA